MTFFKIGTVVRMETLLALQTTNKLGKIDTNDEEELRNG